MTNTFEVPMESMGQYSGFIIMMKLNHCKRKLIEGLVMAALEFQ